MLTSRAVEEHLDSIRPLVSADGADLQLAAVEDGVVTLRLVVEDAHCLECVMPADLLASLIFADISTRLPEVKMIRILDPRDAG